MRVKSSTYQGGFPVAISNTVQPTLLLNKGTTKQLNYDHIRSTSDEHRKLLHRLDYPGADPGGVGWVASHPPLWGRISL